MTWRGTAGRGQCLVWVLLHAALLSSFLPTSTRAQPHIIQAFANRFRQTSGEEFLEIWHSDCHRRCRAQLVSHVNLACAFDPYKMAKRAFTKREANSTARHLVMDLAATPPTPFLLPTTASSFLHKVAKGQRSAHRRLKRGIMNECCYSKSCSWEEYAEYCHTYNRRASLRDTHCLS